MRALTVLVLLFSSSQSFANVPVKQVHGMQLAQKFGMPNPTAAPACKVFEMPVNPDGTVGGPGKLIFSQSLPATQGLMTGFLLPDPYANVQLNVFYGQTIYGETPDATYSYFQANLSQSTTVASYVDASFLMASEKSGDVVLVRGNFSPSSSVALFYQCSLTF